MAVWKTDFKNQSNTILISIYGMQVIQQEPTMKRLQSLIYWSNKQVELQEHYVHCRVLGYNIM